MLPMGRDEPQISGSASLGFSASLEQFTVGSKMDGYGLGPVHGV